MPIERRVNSLQTRLLLTSLAAICAALAVGFFMAGVFPARASSILLGDASAANIQLVTGTVQAWTAGPAVTPTVITRPIPLPIVTPKGTPVPPRRASSIGDVTIAMTLTTLSGDPSIAFDGDFVTYTIFITNNTANSIGNILVLDLLPPNTLDKNSIQCQNNCQRIFDTQQLNDPTGNTIVVTVTTQLSWTIGSLAALSGTQLKISGKVAGQADGTTFTNRAFVAYQGNPGSGLSEVDTLARVRPIQTGRSSLSAAATWFSNDLGGTISQDWADFDHDGNLDLALASSAGTAVYRNVGGQLSKFWGNNIQSYGVAWGDFNNDSVMRLVVVGESVDHNPMTQGKNFIYSRSGTDFVQTGVFTSEFQLVRVVAGVFGGNGNNVDLIASTNTLNAACPVQLFRNNGAGGFISPGECISTEATAAIGVGDFNNDGFPDVVVGQFPNTVKLFVNDSTGHFSNTNSINIDSSISFLPYDFKWGDFDGDGFLDLAAAFPLQREVRIYHNALGAGFDLTPTIKSTNSFMTPLAVEWGDFSGDGHLDLAVGDNPPVVYQFTKAGGNLNFVPSIVMPNGAFSGQLWSMRAVQVRTDGTVDLSLTNRDGPTVLFNAFTPRLNSSLQAIDNFSAQSVGWGDFSNSGRQDLIFGAGSPPAVGARIYRNQNGAFTSANRVEIPASGLGPQTVGVGDQSGDGKLDAALGTANLDQLYLNNQLSGVSSPTWTNSLPPFPNHVVAWGDVNGDGKLDLLAGASQGSVYIFKTTGSTLASTPVYTSPQIGNVRALAWADFNHDGYLDFVAGGIGQPTRIFLNNHDNSFSLGWTTTYISNTTSLAVADFNGDGWPDLAVGNSGQHVVVYENLGGAFGTKPIWSSPLVGNTTSLAWGDWNNDGFPELAVGSDNAPTVVYGNFNSIPGAPRLDLIWSSDESAQTTGVAWGDANGDGYLDLAVSQKSGGQNGVYYNTTVSPSHLTSIFTPTLQLPNNPSYVYVKRPGVTADAYGQSSSDILSGPPPYVPTITVRYNLYDPGNIRTANPIVTSTDIITTYMEFSLDGGSTWQPATPDVTSPSPIMTTTRLGRQGTFVWNAVADQAISDDARFRVRDVHLDRVGPVQRASTSAISPPFKVRAMTCIWPTDPSFSMSTSYPAPGTSVDFVGTVAGGSGVLFFSWDFGDGSPTEFGQFASHTYAISGTFAVHMRVTGEACPITRETVATALIQPGGPFVPFRIFLPIVVQNASAAGHQPGEVTPTPTPTPSASATQTPSATPSLTATGTPLATATATDTASPTASGTPAPSSTATPTPSATASRAPTAATSTPSATSVATSTSTATSAATSSATATRDATHTPTATATPTSAVKTAPTAAPVVSVGGAGDGTVTLKPVVYSAGPLSVLLSMQGPLMPLPRSPMSVAGAPSGAIACNVQQLTFATVGVNNEPVVSTDGSHIAFWSTNDLVPGRNLDGNIEVFLATVDDSGLRFTQVTSSTGSILGGFNLAPSISGNGRRVAFFSDRNLTGQNPDDNFEVFLADIGVTGGVSLTQLTTTTSRVNVFPSISADGRYVAFVSDADLVGQNSDLNQEIFRVEVGANGALTTTQLTNTGIGTLNDHPTISGDGHRVAFISNGDLTSDNQNGARQVFVADIAADQSIQLRQVTPAGSSANNDLPAINGDGTKIAYVSNHNIFVATVGVGVNISAIPSDTPGQNDQPSLSNDGTRVSFVSANGTKISVYDTVLQAPSPLPGSAGASSAHPRMSPDGTHTAFVLDRNIWLSNCPYGELSVTKSADSSVIAGQSVTYTVVVNNAGPSVFNGVVLTDVLPAGVITLTVSPDQIDDDNTGLGFGGGTHSGTVWNAAQSALTLNPTTWALPDAATTTGWFSMTGNVMLLHLDDGAGATSFADTSGQGNSGSCTLPNCPTTGVSGKVNSAAQFNGTNSVINVPHSSNINFAYNQDFAIAVWVKIASVQADTGNDSNYILEKSNGSDAFPYTIRYFNKNSGNAGRILVGRFDDSAPPNGQFPAIYSTRQLGDDEFHHIVFVRSAGMLLLYIDGVLDGSTLDTTGPNTQNNDALLIGQRFGNSNHLQGVIDEVAIFNRPLTSHEVATIYSRQSPAYFGQFDSRVMGSGTITLPWTNLAWTPLQPQLKELPNNNRAEPGYPGGGVNMTGTVLLMHLNEISGTTSFADSSGLNNSGGCSGSGCPLAGVGGRFNTALSFDGAGDSLSLGNPASMNISGTISLEAWVNPRSTSGVQYILAHGDAAGPNPGVFLRINNGTYEVGVANPGLVSAATAMPVTDIGNWIHIAGVFSGTHWIIYRNGVASTSISTTVGAVSSAANWVLGASGAAPVQFFQGSLDEVVVMNRPLSSGEVLDHYRRGALHLKFQARTCSQPDCSDAAFTGPGGSINTFYSELTANLLSTPVVTFTPGLASNPFFQYRAVLDTENPAYLPGVKLVRVSPPHSALQATQGDCFGTSVITCGLGSIGANQSVTVTIIARVDPATRGSLVNNVFVSGNEVDRDQSNNAASRSTLIRTLADLFVSKSASTDIVVPGRVLTYTMFVTNVAGPSFADNTFLVDTLPLFVTPASLSQGCSPSGARVNCALGNLAPGSSISATIVVTVGSGMPTGLFTNTATISSDDNDPNGSNNNAFAAVLARREIDLSIVKSASANPAIAGTTLVYTLSVANAGPSNASGVLVTDVLPTLANTGSASLGCSVSGGVVSCAPFNLAAGLGRLITVAVPLSATVADNTLITNTATITGNEFDTNAANNDTILPTLVQRHADVAVSAAAANSVIAGTSLTYTLTVVNHGPSQASGIVLTDTLPPSSTLQSSGPCTGSGGTVSCNAGTLDVGQNYSATIVVFVDPAARGTLTNSASVSSAEFDPVPANNLSVTTTTINVKTDLRLSKSDAPDPGTAGSPLFYTLTITNDGPSLATNVTITDFLPAGINGVTLASASSSCAANGTNVVCSSIPNLSPNASATVSITVTVNPRARGLLTNNALATSLENPVGATANASTSIAANIDLAVTKTQSSATPSVGGNLTYTVSVFNNGPSTATNVTLTDTLPLTVSLWTVSPTQGTCPPGAPIVCALGNIAPLTSVTTTVVVTVNRTFSGTLISNVANVSAQEPDTNPLNDSATVTATVFTVGDVSIVKTGSTANVVAGTSMVYTLTASNNGPSPVSNVVITDNLPSGVTASSAAGCSISGQLVTCALASMNAHDSTAFFITVNVSGTLPAGDLLDNTAFISSNEFDGDPNNNQSTFDTTVLLSPDLSISKVSTPANARAGDPITYTIIVTDNGPSQATSVVVTDPVPSGVQIQSALSSPGTVCSVAGVTCTLSTLLPGASAYITISAKIDPNWRSPITNIATVSSAQADPNPGNNSATTTTGVSAVTVLSVTKTSNPAIATAGNTLTYTLNVTNAGPSTANGVLLTDALPSNVSFISASGASFTQAGTVVAFQIGNLTPNSNAIVSVVVSVDSHAAGGSTLINVAKATSIENQTGVTFILNTPVTRAVSLAISKSADPSIVAAGNVVTFTINITNSGPSQASNVTVSDTLPVSLSAFAVIRTPSLGGNCLANTPARLYCTAMTLDVGASGVLTAFAVLSPTAPNGAKVTNTALITSAEDLAGMTGSAQVEYSAPGNVQINKTHIPGTIVAGDPMTYIVVMTNTGISAATNVTMRDALPDIGSVTSVMFSAGSCSVSGGEQICTIPSLAPSARVVVTFGINISSSIANNFPASNTASVTTSQSVLGNSYTDFTQVKRRLTLAYSQDDSTQTPVAGTTLTYTISITNIGPSDASNVTISDTMPVSATLDGINSYPTCAANGRSVNCPIAGPLPVNSSFSVPIVVRIDPAAKDGAVITNTVHVTSSEILVGPTVAITETVQKQVSLAVSESAADPATAGVPLIYSIYTSNSGPSQASGVKLTDTLPVSTTFRPLGSSPYCSAAPGNTVVCAPGTVDGSGGLTTTTIVVIPNQAIISGTVITNSVVVTATEIPALVPDQISGTVIRQVQFDLVKLDSRGGGFVSLGTPLTYTIDVTDTGVSAASNVVITDTLPPSLTFTIRSFAPASLIGPSVGTTFPGGSTLTYTAPTMSSGSAAHISLSTTVNLTPTGNIIVNTAGVQSSETVTTTIVQTVNFFN